jgi:hypothetical protein
MLQGSANHVPQFQKMQHLHPKYHYIKTVTDSDGKMVHSSYRNKTLRHTWQIRGKVKVKLSLCLT